ncbi:MAG: YciI family protein [Cyclobacteriaceae bacterium]
MEKFMFIFIGGMDPSQSPEAMQTSMQEWFAWIDKLKKEGRYEGGEPLDPVGKVVSGPKKIITDGPFAEGKEIVGGFFVVKAKNLDEAVTIAKDCPDLKHNSRVEVRPVMKIEM